MSKTARKDQDDEFKVFLKVLVFGVGIGLCYTSIVFSPTPAWGQVLSSIDEGETCKKDKLQNCNITSLWQGGTGTVELTGLPVRPREGITMTVPPTATPPSLVVGVCIEAEASECVIELELQRTIITGDIVLRLQGEPVGVGMLPGIIPVSIPPAPESGTVTIPVPFTPTGIIDWESSADDPANDPYGVPREGTRSVPLDSGSGAAAAVRRNDLGC